MIKKNWSNPELKELSIEYTQASKLICDSCGQEDTLGATNGQKCYYVVPDPEWGSIRCDGTFREEMGTDFIS